ncbi:MAG TPA: HEAT repeat domain-containing protein [Pseudonocardia sp.]|jgi:hypothetical protein|nr:HEAT repeat domain-containing protein [Pseudonocardia sp.]
MLDGDDSDPSLIVALGGPPAQDLIDRGLPAHQRYWLRVWAARGLLWAWDDEAESMIVNAATDEQWRVRELTAKVVARHHVSRALPAMRLLVEDEIPRVRAAALRAVERLDG